MIRILTLFLTSIVFMHATVGCCLHHAHACEVDCCDTPAITSEECLCHKHEEGAVAIPSGLVNDSNREHDAHSCDGDACAAFVAQSSDDDLADILDQPPALTCCVAELNAVVSIAQTPEQGIPSDVVSSAPRLHLILSVMLI
jgi:hypothetical protein